MCVALCYAFSLARSVGLAAVTAFALQCIEIAVNNPPAAGEPVEIFNQVAETRRVRDLAQMISDMTGCGIKNVPNPRQEAAENDLEVSNEKFRTLGFEPTKLDEGLFAEVVRRSTTSERERTRERERESQRGRVDRGRPTDREQDRKDGTTDRSTAPASSPLLALPLPRGSSERTRPPSGHHGSSSSPSRVASRRAKRDVFQPAPPALQVREITDKYKDRCVQDKVLPSSFWNKKRVAAQSMDAIEGSKDQAQYDSDLAAPSAVAAGSAPLSQ